MISSASASMSSSPWRSHSDRRRWAPTSPDAIWAWRSPAMWSGWRTLERMNFHTSWLRSPATISRQIGIHRPSSNTSRPPAPMP